MIIQIAGTSGSGKSHLVRDFMSWIDANGGALTERRVGSRATPLGYDVCLPKAGGSRPRGASLHIVGAYDSPTGGCDTIRDVVQLYDLILEEHNKGIDILYEGLFVMNHTRGPKLVEQVDGAMVVLQLTTPFATCVNSINNRRDARGEGKLVNKENTRSNFVRAENYCKKMAAAGAGVIKVRRDQGLDTLLELLECK